MPWRAVVREARSAQPVVLDNLEGEVYAIYMEVAPCLAVEDYPVIFVGRGCEAYGQMPACIPVISPLVYRYECLLGLVSRSDDYLHILAGALQSQGYLLHPGV